MSKIPFSGFSLLLLEFLAGRWGVCPSSWGSRTLDLETGHADQVGDLSSFFTCPCQWAWLIFPNVWTAALGTGLSVHFSWRLAFVWVCSPNKRPFNLGPGELFMAQHIMIQGAGSPDTPILWWPSVEDMDGLSSSQAPLALGSRGRSQPAGDRHFQAGMASLSMRVAAASSPYPPEGDSVMGRGE